MSPKTSTKPIIVLIKVMLLRQFGQWKWHLTHILAFSFVRRKGFLHEISVKVATKGLTDCGAFQGVLLKALAIYSHDRVRSPAITLRAFRRLCRVTVGYDLEPCIKPGVFLAVELSVVLAVGTGLSTSIFKGLEGYFFGFSASSE